MTKTQMKKLVASLCVEATVSGRGAEWEVECADRRASVLIRRAMRQAKVQYNGFKAGWGGWVYRAGPGRTGYQYDCDFGDKASIHHY